MDSPYEVSAPGKVILHGEHSVVHGKRAIACALGSRITVSVTPSIDSDEISFIMSSLAEEKIAVSIKELMAACQNVGEGQSLSVLVQKFSNKKYGTLPSPFICLALSCCIYGYCKVFFGKKTAPGVNLTVTSELPIGAGLGSSAAFNTSIACAFLLLSGDIVPPNNCDNITEFKMKESLEKIDSLAYEMESIVHSTPSGIDNSIATYGQAVSFQSGSVARIDRMPELKLLIVDTGVARSTKTLVANVRDYKMKYPQIVDPILDSMHNIAIEAENLLHQLHSGEDSAQALVNYGCLLTTNHCLLAGLGVSHPSLDKICLIASKHGYPSKLTGAGGGGCAFILLTNMEKTEALKRDLSLEGFKYWMAALGGSGVMVKRI